jgi:glycosyltransferase involved in cell wall biosynthesis
MNVQDKHTRVEEGVTGCLVPPGDPGALAERLISLARDPALLRAMTDAVKASPVKTLSENVSEYAALYQALLAEGSTPDGSRAPDAPAVGLTAAAPDAGGARVREWLGFDGRCDRLHLGSLDYQSWIERRSQERRCRPPAPCAASPDDPLLHFFVTLREPRLEALAATVLSLAQQDYPRERLAVTVVCAGAPCAGADDLWLEAVDWIEAGTGSDLVRALNRGIFDCAASWIAVLAAGDVVEPDFARRCVGALQANPRWELLYVDEDSMTSRGERYAPLFKPDLNPDLLRSLPYVGTACLARRAAVLEVGAFGPHEGFEHHDLVLKVLDRFGAGSIGHVPHLLYHRLDAFPAEAPGDRAAGRLVLERHLLRNGLEATVAAGPLPGSYRVQYRHRETPLVSIVVPTAGGSTWRRRVQRLLARTDYPEVEVIVVQPGFGPEGAGGAFPDARVRLVGGQAHASRPGLVNAGCREARGDYLLTLDETLEPAQPDWLGEMMAHALRPGVGAVGARVLSPDGRVLHAGLVLGLGSEGIAESPARGTPVQDAGYMGRAHLVQSLSAVSGACLLVGRELYLRLGGLDQGTLPELWSDVDFCLRIRQAGLGVVWTPFANLVRSGRGRLDAGADPAPGDGSSEAAHTMLERWLPQLVGDPAYHPQLSLTAPAWRPEARLWVPWDRRTAGRPRLLSLSGESRDWAVQRADTALALLHRAGLADCATVSQPHAETASATALARMGADSLLFGGVESRGLTETLRRLGRHGSTLRVLVGGDRLAAASAAGFAENRSGQAPGDPWRVALSLCGRLLVPTPLLGERCRPWVEDVAVVPPRLERERWGSLTARRREGPQPRVGLVARPGEAPDLELIGPAVAALRGEVHWVVLGECSPALRSLVREVHPMVPEGEYPAKLASLGLDLALAPMASGQASEARSGVRVLEYGALGWPVLCSDVPPYREAPVFRVANDVDAWVEAIRERVHDPEAARREAETLRQWVFQRGMLEDHLDEWLSALTP